MSFALSQIPSSPSYPSQTLYSSHPATVLDLRQRSLASHTGRGAWLLSLDYGCVVGGSTNGPGIKA